MPLPTSIGSMYIAGLASVSTVTTSKLMRLGPAGILDIHSEPKIDKLVLKTCKSTIIALFKKIILAL